MFDKALQFSFSPPEPLKLSWGVHRDEKFQLWATSRLLRAAARIFLIKKIIIIITATLRLDLHQRTIFRIKKCFRIRRNLPRQWRTRVSGSRLIFRPNWGQKICLRPGPPLSQGVDDRSSLLIWRSASAIARLTTSRPHEFLRMRSESRIYLHRLIRENLFACTEYKKYT